MAFNRRNSSGTWILLWKLPKSNIPAFFTTIQILPKRFDLLNIYTMGKLGFDRLFEQIKSEAMEFTIKPRQDEMVIHKHTASIFIDTGFERMQERRHCHSCLHRHCHGVWNRVQRQGCFQQGVLLVAALDCVSSPYKEGHEKLIENMKNLLTVTESREILKVWSTL